MVVTAELTQIHLNKCGATTICVAQSVALCLILTI